MSTVSVRVYLFSVFQFIVKVFYFLSCSVYLNDRRTRDFCGREFQWEYLSLI